MEKGEKEDLINKLLEEGNGDGSLQQSPPSYDQFQVFQSSNRIASRERASFLSSSLFYSPLSIFSNGEGRDGERNGNGNGKNGDESKSGNGNGNKSSSKNSFFVIAFLIGSVICNSLLVFTAQSYDYTTLFYGFNSIMAAIGLIGISGGCRPIFLIYTIYYGLSFLFEAMLYAAAIFVLYQDEAAELIQEMGYSNLVKSFNIAENSGRIQLLFETSFCSIGLLFMEIVMFDQLLRISKTVFKKKQ